MSGKITGADLLKGLKSRNNSSTDKDKKEKKKKKVTGADLLSGANEIQRYRTIDTSGVNDDYINSFISDADSFFKGVEETSNGMNWNNASSVYDSTNSKWKAIQDRGATIKAWLYKNKDKIDPEYYNSLSTSLSDIDSGASAIIKEFDSLKALYGSFETEDDYNAWKNKEDFVTAYIADSEKAKADFEYEDSWLKEADRRKIEQVAMSAEDFGVKSKYKSTKLDGFWNKVNSDYFSGYGDVTYEYVNNTGDIRDDIESLSDVNQFLYSGLTGAYFNETDQAGMALDYMTEDEVKVYNYVYSTKGKKDAEAYLESLKETLVWRKANDKYENGWASTNGFTQWIFRGVAGLDNFYNSTLNTDEWFGGEAPDLSYMQYMNQMAEEDLGNVDLKWYDFSEMKWKDQDIFGKSLGQVGGDLLNTTANMAPSIALSFVPYAGPALSIAATGLSAAGNAYSDAYYNQGMDVGEAQNHAFVVGASEAILQYFLGGISRLGGKGGGNGVFNTIGNKALSKVNSAAGRVAIKLGSSMADEALEEIVQTYIEEASRSLFTHTDFDAPDAEEVLYSGLLGALSAGLLEGSGTIGGEIKTSKAGQIAQNAGAVDRLVKLGSTYSADSVAYKLAGKVNENTGAYTIGRLLNEVGATLTEQNQAEIIKSLTRKGMTERDAKVHAKWLSKVVEGEGITSKQNKILDNNDVVSKTFFDVIINKNSTVNQRLQGYNEAIAQIMNGGNAKATVETAQNQAKASETGIASGDSETPQIEGNAEAEAKKTVLVETGEEVSVAGISSIKNGVVTVRLEDGREVNAKDIDFSSKQEGLVYEAVADMSQEKAQDFIDGLQEGNVGNGENQISFEQYFRGFNNAYRHGTISIPTAETARDTFASQLTDRQRQIAYNRGKADSIAKVKADQAKADAKKATLSKTENVEGEGAKDAQSSKVTKKGKVTYLNGANPTGSRQKSAVKAIEILSETIGNNWYVFSSYVENGKRVYKDIDGKVKPAPNGKYDSATGDIYIDLNAGVKGDSLMIFTMAHELTHLMRQWSPAKFKVFADFVLEQYGKKGVSVEGLIQRKISNAKNNGREITYDEAYEEVIADSAESMLRDSNALEVISKLKAKDKSVWTKIKDFISNMVKKIRAAYAKLNPDSIEGRMVLEMKDVAEKLQALWTEGLLDAAEAYSNAIVQVDTDSQSVAPTMFSERTWTESEYVQEREETAKKIAKALNVSVDVATAYIDDINSVARLVADDRVRLDYEPNLDDKATVLKKNSDYKFSVDMSTLCAKRLLFTGTFDAIQRQLPDTAFDSDDIVRIRAMMEERGYEVACGICYVESTRREIGTITADFINSYKEAQKSGKPIARVNSEGKSVELKKTKEQLETTVDATTDKFYAEKDYTPTLADLNTTDIDLVKKEHPTVYEAYLNFMNARGQAKPKLLETRAEYKGEILKHFKAKSAVDARNNAGGLRLQSFSDFEVPHLIDMMQITMDMARVGLKAQAYTKVPNFADAFGNTGIKINLSLIAKGSGLDSNGNLIFDDKEGINHEEAFRLRDKFSKNVGTILVGKNDAHIVAAMADPRIDYIIPFHKSSWKESLYDALGLTGYADYTDFQNEKYLDADRGKVKNFDPSEYWDYSKTGDENAQIYLEKCREDGRIPKFPQFQGYKGYWKLLIDFKMYDNDGVGSPQDVVRPIFDNATNEKILNEYKGGHRSFPEAKDVVSDFVKEYKDGMKHSDSDFDGFKYSDRVTDVETLEFLENQETLRVYRAMQVIDGKLYPPMAAKVKSIDGKKNLVTPSEIGAWEQAVERPDLIRNGNKFELDKANGSSIQAAYNPYFHTSASPLNDQFTSAYKRENLVVVEGEIPVSELTSGYRAEFAKDTVGETKWHSGVVASKLKGDKARKVYLSRWFKPVRIVPDSEVATKIAETLKGENIDIPYNVVTPSLRAELEKAGVAIKYSDRDLASTENPDIRYSFRDSDSGMANDALSPYDDELKGFIERRGDYIVDSFDKLQQIVNMAFDKPQLKATAYFGIINTETLEKIKNSTHNLPKSVEGILFKKGRDYSIAVTLDSIRHMVDEKSSLTREDIIDFLDRLADTIVEFDTVAFSFYEKKGERIPGLLFDKKFSDGTLSSYNFVSQGKRSLVLQSFYMDSGDYQKKKSAETLLLQKATTHTSETQVSQTSDKIVSENDKSVKQNSNISENSQKFSERDPDSVSNRSLLANALESAAQNDIEKNKLAQYKQKIELIESEEAKLHKIREEIKELSFAKGRRDVEKIKKLQFEANQASNRINTYDRQLLTLEASKPLKDVLEREKNLAYKRAEQKGKEALAAYREKTAKTTRELMTRYQESRERATESRRKTEYRNKIKKVVGDLNQLLTRPTKDKHVKEGLKTAVAEALSVINMDTVGADERVAKYNELIAKTNDPDMIAELTQTRDRIELQGENLKDKLTSLQAVYEKIKNSTDPELKNAYQEPVMNAIKATVELVGNTSLRDMTLTQLEAVYEMYTMVLHTVRTANKAFKAQKGETITQLSEAVNSEVRNISKEKFVRNPIVAYLRKVGWTLLKPFTAFRTIGSDTFTGLYKELRNGEDTYYVDVDEGRNFIHDMYEKHGFKSWDQKETKTFTAKSGKTFTLNLEQMMSLYAYSRRNQAHDHIIEGGIVLEDSVVVTKKKLGIPVKYKVDTKTAFNLSEETLAEICDSLTNEQKAFVEDMQTYLSDVMGAKGNEVSMELLGVKLFKEKFYFPLKSSKYYMGFKPEEAGEIKLKNPAFSKETVHHANNPVVLKGFTDVWAEHVHDMSMYHAFVLPLEDFTRVYNYKTKTDENVETMSTEATIANAYGEGATEYIRNFLRSLNGGVRVQGTPLAEGLISKTKKAAVLGSASVIIQQPSAIVRAMALINPKYFVATTRKSLNLVKHSQDWTELKRYAPIAGIKEMGRFDVGMGQSTVKWIKDQNNILEKADEALSKAPAYMDELTWVGIWNAVKNEVQNTNKDLQVDSEEYFKKCGERFTEVVSLTQVYDSVFSRSDLMRNGNPLAKMITAFMAEPSTTLNMIIDSIIQGKRTGSVKGLLKTTAGTTGAIFGSIVLNSALKSIITAMRDDDEDETYAEKYIGAFAGNMKDGINPLTYIPLAKDVVSLFQGYEVERMDMALISDLVSAWNAFDSDSKSDYEKWTGFIGAISALVGIPFKNVERDVRGAFNTIKSFGNGEETTSMGISSAIKEAWTGEKESNSQQLYEAIVSGDTAHAERVKSRFKDQDAIDSAMKKGLRENDSRINKAAKARIDGDIDGYTRIAKEIIAEGNFKQDIVVSAINAEINAIKRGEAEKNATTESSSTVESDEVTSIYSSDDINVAFDKGDTALAKSIIQDLIDTKMANGKEEKEARSSIRSSMTSHWKALYLEAYRKGDTEEMYRIRLILLNSGLYGSSNDVVKTVQGWLKEN